jgi:hypothetical protein
LVYLPSSDAALARRSRKYSHLSAVVVRFSRERKRYERQRILVTSEVIEKAEQECFSAEGENQTRTPVAKPRILSVPHAAARCSPFSAASPFDFGFGIAMVSKSTNAPVRATPANLLQNFLYVVHSFLALTMAFILVADFNRF